DLPEERSARAPQRVCRPGARRPSRRDGLRGSPSTSRRPSQDPRVGRLVPARSLLAGGDHGGTLGFALGDASVGPLREELLERLVEGLLIEGHLRTMLVCSRCGRRGWGGGGFGFRGGGFGFRGAGFGFLGSGFLSRGFLGRRRWYLVRCRCGGGSCGGARCRRRWR